MATANVPSLNDCPDMIFIDGNENDSSPSNGVGGGFPGEFSRSIVVNANNETFYYYIPSSYQNNKPMPIMTVWHGAVYAGGGPAAAQSMIDFWKDEAEARNFIVVAQAIVGSPGCDPCGWRPYEDSVIFAAILDDMEARYNIETTRRYVWGFSAGGFVMHAIALNNADYFAGYAISGAHLGYANSAGYTPANATRQLPVYISIGQSDQHYAGAVADLTDFYNAGWGLNSNIWFDGFIGGHELLYDLPAKAWDKICISTVLD